MINWNSERKKAKKEKYEVDLYNIDDNKDKMFLIAKEPNKNFVWKYF